MTPAFNPHDRCTKFEKKKKKKMHILLYVTFSGRNFKEGVSEHEQLSIAGPKAIVAGNVRVVILCTEVEEDQEDRSLMRNAGHVEGLQEVVFA
jgi:hypothetical protein